MLRPAPPRLVTPRPAPLRHAVPRHTTPRHATPRHTAPHALPPRAPPRQFRLAAREEIVDDLYEDLKDGWVLYALLEELSGQSLRPLGKMNRGKLRIQHVDNMNVVFKYLTNTVKIVGIGPQDIVDSTNHTLVLGLIWSIIVFFMAKDIEGAGKWKGSAGKSSATMQDLKKTILSWVQLHTNPVDGVHATNVSSDLSDGSVLLTILNRVDPDSPQLEILPDSKGNVSRALHYAEEKYGVPIFVDENDPSWSSDDMVVIPQLVQWMKRLPDIEVLDAERKAEEAEEAERVRLERFRRTRVDTANKVELSDAVRDTRDDSVGRALMAESTAKMKLVEEARLEAEAEATAATEQELLVAKIAKEADAAAKKTEAAAAKAKERTRTAHVHAQNATKKAAAAERELQRAAKRRSDEAAAVEGGSPDRGARMRQRFLQEEAEMAAEAADLAKAAAEEKAEHDRENARLVAEAAEAARDAEATVRAIGEKEKRYVCQAARTYRNIPSQGFCPRHRLRLAAEADAAAKVMAEQEEAQKAAVAVAAAAKEAAKAEAETEAVSVAAAAEEKRIEAELQMAAVKAQQTEARREKEEARQASLERRRQIEEDQEWQRAAAKASEEETQAAAKTIEDMKVRVHFTYARAQMD